MSAQRHYDATTRDSRSISSSAYLQPQTHRDSTSDRRRSKTVNGYLESEDERYTSRRDREGKQRSSSRSSRVEAVTAGALYHSTLSISRDVTPHSRPPSRGTVSPTHQMKSSESSLHAHVPLQSSSRSQRWRSDTPELHDVRAYSAKRNMATPTRKPSFEQVSGAEDNSNAIHHLRTHSNARTPTPVAPFYSEHDTSTSRRHTGRDWEGERRREKVNDKNNAENVRVESKSRDKKNTRETERMREVDRTKEIPGTQEFERSAERRRDHRSHTEIRPSSRQTAPSAVSSNYRIEESDLSDSGRRRLAPTMPHGHRRYRTEEGTQSTSSDRRQHSDRPQSSITTNLTSRSANVPAYSTTHSHSIDLTTSISRPHGQIPQPTPRIMPVFLPEQKAKATKSHHERNTSLPSEISTSALTDTEGVKCKEIRLHSDRARSHVDSSARMSENKISALPLSRQHPNRYETAVDATSARLPDASTGKLFHKSRLSEALPAKILDVRSNISDIARPAASTPMHPVENHKQTTDMHQLIQGVGDTRSTDLAPKLKSDSPPYYTAPRLVDRSARDRTDGLYATESSASLANGSRGPSMKTLPKSMTQVVQPSVASYSAAAPLPAQATILSVTSHSRSASEDIGAQEKATPTSKHVNRDFPSSVSILHASPAAVAPSPQPLSYSKVQRGYDDARLYAPTASQMQSSGTQTTRTLTQLPGLQQDYVMNRPPESSDGAQAAQETLPLKTSPTIAVQVSSKEIRPLLNPVELASSRVPSHVRETRPPGHSVKAREVLGANINIVNVGQPKPNAMQQLEAVRKTYDDVTLPSTSSRPTAEPSLKGALTNFLPSLVQKQPAISPESTKHPNRSQLPEDGTTTSVTNNATIQQIQGHLQKSLSTTKPAEREMPANVASHPESNTTELAAEPTKTSGKSELHPLPRLNADELARPSGPVGGSVNSNTISIFGPLPPTVSRIGKDSTEKDAQVRDFHNGVDSVAQSREPSNVVFEKQASLSQARPYEQTPTMTGAKRNLSDDFLNQVSPSVPQVKFESVLASNLAPRSLSGTVHSLQYHQAKPIVPIAALTSDRNVSTRDSEHGQATIRKTPPLNTTAVREGIERNITPQFYIPPLPAATTMPEPSQSSKTHASVNVNVYHVTIRPTTQSVTEGNFPKQDVHETNSISRVHPSDSPSLPVLSLPTKSPSHSPRVLVNSSPQAHRLLALTSTQNARSSPSHIVASLNARSSPRNTYTRISDAQPSLMTQAVESDTRPPATGHLPTHPRTMKPISNVQAPLPDVHHPVSHVENVISRPENRVHEASIAVPREVHEELNTLPLTNSHTAIRQESKHHHMVISPSPSLDTRASSSTASPAILKSEISHPLVNSSQTPNGLKLLQEDSHRLHFLSKDAAGPQSEDRDQIAPSSSIKSHAHRTSPDNIYSRALSRNSPMLTNSHNGVSTSPVLHTNPSQSPENHTGLHKASESPKDSGRVNSVAQSYSKSLSTQHSPTSSKLHEKRSAVDSPALDHNSITAMQHSSTGIYPIAKVPNHPPRTQDVPASALQLSIHPQDAVVPAMNHLTSVPTMQTQDSSLPSSSNVPPLNHNQSSRPDSVRAQPSTGQRHQATILTTHSRNASHPPPTPTATRVSTSANRPAPIVTNQTQIERNISTESESILQTPSSLANSRPPSRNTSRAPPSVAYQESRKKDNVPDTLQPKSHADLSSNEQLLSKTSKRDEPRTTTRSTTKVSAERSSFYDIPPLTVKTRDLPPIVVPNSTSIALSLSDYQDSTGVSSNSFRLVTSHKHRRVSTASLEAVNGTAANTVIGSPTTSIHSQAMLPPMRDPLVAAQEWRNKEEAELKERRNARRYRPGVVFDVSEEVRQDHRTTRQSRR